MIREHGSLRRNEVQIPVYAGLEAHGRKVKLQATQVGNNQPEPFDFSIMRRELRMLSDNHVLQRRSIECV